MLTFSQIIGQEKAKGFLKKVLARDKTPHAYIFSGIYGIGKTSTAMALSMALNCLSPVNSDACGECRPCRQMKGGNFPDFISLLPDGQNIKIDQIRELNRQLSFAPVAGKYRVCVLHQSEAMTSEAANSFLKTLEEPPSGTIFILKASESLNLLPTIVSRCQRINFQPLPVQEITAWLVKERGLNEETAMILAKTSGGSLGLAIKMSENDFLDKRQKWLLSLINLPAMSGDEAFEMALEYATGKAKSAKNSSDGEETGVLDILGVWQNWYRDLLLVKDDCRTDLLINPDFQYDLKNTSKNYKMTNLIKAMMKIDQAQTDIIRMRNSKIVMEYTVICLRNLALDKIQTTS
ncbi:MAG: DNA polymerase III subunit delta' [Deltaproteobacteria bacterium]|nr:DNA polymerase III subunit delta' [Deltaproteobacteria bacterium]